MEHLAVQVLWETVRVLITRVSFMVTRARVLLFVADVAERNEDAWVLWLWADKGWWGGAESPIRVSIASVTQGNEDEGSV